MSTRQYIGARYVPKFYQNSVDGSAAWESNVVYEPLTWVTLTNGHIYLSRKQVPATVGIPSQNVDYWLDVGSYNGFIESLQEQIDALKMGDKILFVGDSYGISTNSSNKTIPDVAAACLKTTSYDQIHRAGAGFTRDNVGVNFKDVISGYTGDKTKITHIYIYGGANDIASTTSDIISGIVECVTYCKANFANLKKIMFAAASMTFAPERHRLGVRQCYETLRTCDRYGIEFIKNSQYIMHNTNLSGNDNLHPNSDGVNEIGMQLAKGFVSGCCDVEYRVQVAGTGYAGSDYTVTVNTNLHRYLHNELNAIYFLGETIATVNFSTQRATNNFDDPVITVASPFIIPYNPTYDSNVDNEYYESCPCIAIISHSGGTVTVPAKLYINTAGNLVFRCSTGGSGYAGISSVVIRQCGPLQLMTDMS